MNTPKIYAIAIFLFSLASIPIALSSQTKQKTTGPCSPAVAGTGGSVTIIIKGCKGISPKVLTKWQALLSKQYRQLLKANSNQVAALKELRKDLREFRQKHAIDAKVQRNTGNYKPTRKSSKGLENRFIKLVVNSVSRNRRGSRVYVSVTITNKSKQDILIMHYKWPSILGNDGIQSYKGRVRGLKVYRGRKLSQTRRSNYTRILGQGQTTVNFIFGIHRSNADYYSMTSKMAIYDPRDPNFPIEFDTGLPQLKLR